VTRQHLDRTLEQLKPHLPWVAIAASLVVFVDVIGNGFFRDDYLHLYNNSNVPLMEALLAPHGGHWLFTYNAIFLLLFKLFGLNSAAFFTVLLLVHSLCIYLVYAIVERLTQRPHLAAFGATLWGMCPVNVGSLGWISVLGHVFATAAILWVVLDLVRLEQGPQKLRLAIIVRMYFLLLVAASSFGIGLGVAMGFPVLFFLWNPVPSQRIKITLLLSSIMLVIPLAYFSSGQFDAGAGAAPLAKSLEFYGIGLLRLPANLLRFLLVSGGSLLGGPALIGDIVMLPEAWIVPVAKTLGASCCAVIALAIYPASVRMRWRILTLVALLCCCYGPIAVARWFSLPVIIPRYHYLGPAVFSILLCLGLATLAGRVDFFRRNGGLLYLGWLLLAIVPYTMATNQNDNLPHLQQREQHHRSVLELHQKLNQQFAGSDGTIYLQNQLFVMSPLVTRNSEFRKTLQDPGLAGLFIIVHPENSYRGRSVRFVEPDERIRRLARSQVGSRISELFLSPKESQKNRRVERQKARRAKRTGRKPGSKEPSGQINPK
jgi:hypothetical protein